MVLPEYLRVVIASTSFRKNRSMTLFHRDEICEFNNYLENANDTMDAARQMGRNKPVCYKVCESK